MTKPVDLLKRQVETNMCHIVEIGVLNLALSNEIKENNESITLLEAANSELQIAISRLEENV